MIVDIRIKIAQWQVIPRQDAVVEAWNAICTSDFRSDPSASVAVLDFLSQLIGRDEVELQIQNTWSAMPEFGRINVCYAIQSPSSISTKMAIDLFDSKGSRVHERHLILAGLAKTSKERDCRSILLGLVNRVGEYVDTNKQAVLDTLKKSVNAMIDESRNNG